MISPDLGFHSFLAKIHHPKKYYFSTNNFFFRSVFGGNAFLNSSTIPRMKYYHKCQNLENDVHFNIFKGHCLKEYLSQNYVSMKC